MNESDVEHEMRKLRPARPSQNLEARIARDLDAAPLPVRRKRDDSGVLMRWLDRLLWTGLGAAATAALMISPKPVSPETALSETAPSASLQPVLVSEENQGWKDEGVYFNERGQPLLKLRRTAVEKEAWADLQHAGVVQVERPRQEVMWVPMALH